MKIDTSLIHAYLEDTPVENSTAYRFLEKFSEPDKKRKDVVVELLSSLEDIAVEFPVFNADLWNRLFPDSDELLNTITLVPLVGSTPPCCLVKQQEHEYFILLDLIYIADFTRIVSQMVYILQNYLTLEVAKICIHAHYPLTSHQYIDLLDFMTFTHGLASWLAWNADCNTYHFQNERYEPYKEKAFGMLAQAAQVENKALQHKVLSYAHAKDFWDQFPAVAGMFYFDDVYHDVGKDGVLLLYTHGPKHFVHTIFHT